MPDDQKPSLTYEETPIIDPVSGEVAHAAAPDQADAAESLIPEAARVFQPGPSASSSAVAASPSPIPGPPVPPQRPSEAKKRGHAGTVLFVMLLFGLGVWLSGQLRSFFTPTVSQEVSIPTSAPFAYATPTKQPLASPSAVMTPGAWQKLSVINGYTKQPIDGMSYQLPGDIAVPVCDSASCASQGTNLPGGTRFTVAPRGKGQVLPDFRGAILTDAGGKEFVMKQTLIGSVYVYEYTGDFTGRTGGGYTFTKMRGVLLPVSETLAVEFNHFAPAGITADFSKDDALFDSIIKTFATKGYIAPATPTMSVPTSTPTASASGF